MRCRKCGGRLGVPKGWDHTGGYVRQRKCDSCDFTSMSIEVLMSSAAITKLTGEPAWQGAKAAVPLRMGGGRRA